MTCLTIINCLSCGLVYAVLIASFRQKLTQFEKVFILVFIIEAIRRHIVPLVLQLIKLNVLVLIIVVLIVLFAVIHFFGLVFICIRVS